MTEAEYIAATSLAAARAAVAALRSATPPSKGEGMVRYEMALTYASLAVKELSDSPELEGC